jgi:hypothetical protein
MSAGSCTAAPGPQGCIVWATVLLAAQQQRPGIANTTVVYLQQPWLPVWCLMYHTVAAAAAVSVDCSVSQQMYGAHRHTHNSGSESLPCDRAPCYTMCLYYQFRSLLLFASSEPKYAVIACRNSALCEQHSCL